MATTGNVKRRRQNAARLASDCSGSSTASRLLPPPSSRRGDPRCVIGRDDGGGGAARKRLRDKFVSVEALAFDRDKELARTDDARIDADAVEPGIAPFEPRGYRLRHGRGIDHLPLHDTSARAACSASLNGSRAPLHS